MSLSQTSCLALLKGMDYLGKLYGEIVAATVFNMVCRLKLIIQLIAQRIKHFVLRSLCHHVSLGKLYGDDVLSTLIDVVCKLKWIN